MKTRMMILTLIAVTLMAAACSSGAPAEPVVEYEIVEEAPAEALATSAAPQGSDSTFLAAGPLAVAPPASRMVIKDAEMELLVENTDRSISQVTQLAADYGGYIISSQTWIEADQKFASLRLGIPSASFEMVLNDLRIMGIDVLQETASGQDVSAEYVDLETRLTNLEATSARVRSFLEAAETVEESLQVSAELAELEAQIEQIKGQMRYYEGRAAFSTVTVLLTPQAPELEPTPTPTPDPVWSPADTVKEASQVAVRIGQGALDILIWFIFLFGPILLLGGIGLGIFWWLRKRFPGKRDPAEPGS